MINHAKMKVGKTTHKLKFSTAALMRMEAENDGKPFDMLLDRLITGKGGASLVISALAAGLDDGKGVEREKAVALVDAVGGVRKAVPFVGEAIAAAFPAEADPDADPDEDAEGNTEGNGQAAGA